MQRRILHSSLILLCLCNCLMKLIAEFLMIGLIFSTEFWIIIGLFQFGLLNLCYKL
jgi:uncharacterized membrane protein